VTVLPVAITAWASRRPPKSRSLPLPVRARNTSARISSRSRPRTRRVSGSGGCMRNDLTSIRNSVRDLKRGGFAPGLSATNFLLDAYHAPEEGTAVDLALATRPAPGANPPRFAPLDKVPSRLTRRSTASKRGGVVGAVLGSRGRPHYLLLAVLPLPDDQRVRGLDSTTRIDRNRPVEL